MEAKYPEITLGATICDKLKIIYFDQIPWITCYKDVATHFSTLKNKMRTFYNDKNTDEILKKLRSYSLDDIKDAMEICH